MRREFHVRFCEGPGVQSPRATRRVFGSAVYTLGRSARSDPDGSMRRFDLD
jgi:hypothetical protein